MTEATTGKPKRVRRFALTLLMWAAIGGAVGYFLKPLARTLGWNLSALDLWMDAVFGDASLLVAGALAVLYVVGGLVGFALVYLPQLAMNDSGLGGREDLIEQRISYLWQSVAMTALGLALLALVLAEPLQILAPQASLAIFALSIAVAIYAYRNVWRTFDELMRSMTREAAMFGYFAMAAIGGGWAALDQLGFVAGPQSLDWLSLFWAMGIASSLWAASKRGMIEIG